MHLQWDQLAFFPSMAAEGTCHAPLPKEGHLGILPQRGVEAAPCGQISQPEVCQLLVTSPQVVYPIGLNGHDEPIITSLPELLASGISLTAGESIYLGIDIPSPPVEESDQKILPLGDVSTTVVAGPHKSPPKLEGCRTMEVRNLLSQAMLETSSCGSEHSPARRHTPVVVPTTPPQKPEGPLQPVDTSSQASAKVAEASLEDIHASISPIASISRTGSVTPLVDAMELQANANKALKDLLTTKASIDAWRQRAIWELSTELCLNESKGLSGCSGFVLHHHQRGQGCLFLCYSRSQGHLLKDGKRSQNDPLMLHMREQGCVLHGHQRCRGPQGLPG